MHIKGVILSGIPYHKMKLLRLSMPLGSKLWPLISPVAATAREIYYYMAPFKSLFTM